MLVHHVGLLVGGLHLAHLQVLVVQVIGHVEGRPHLLLIDALVHQVLVLLVVQSIAPESEVESGVRSVHDELLVVRLRVVALSLQVLLDFQAVLVLAMDSSLGPVQDHRLLVDGLV